MPSNPWAITQPPSAAMSLRMYEDAELIACPDNEQLAVEVELALMHLCPASAAAVSITARDGVVHLRGSVSSERKLVLMHKVVRGVAGIRWICNDVTVLRPATRVNQDLAVYIRMPASA